jgi:peptidoglycan/LPS O-acetylase OafA/YrhL
LAASNTTLFFQDWILFLGIEANEIRFTPNFSTHELPLYLGLIVPQAWTLGVELSFYLIAPFLLARRKALLAFPILSLGVRIVLHIIELGRDDSWVYRFYPAELSFFILGAISHQFLLPTYEKIIPKKTLA